MRVKFSFVGEAAQERGEEPLWADLDCVPPHPETVDIPGLDHRLTSVRNHVWFPFADPPYVEVVLGAPLWTLI